MQWIAPMSATPTACNRKIKIENWKYLIFALHIFWHRRALPACLQRGYHQPSAKSIGIHWICRGHLAVAVILDHFVCRGVPPHRFANRQIADWIGVGKSRECIGWNIGSKPHCAPSGHPAACSSNDKIKRNERSTRIAQIGYPLFAIFAHPKYQTLIYITFFLQFPLLLLPVVVVVAYSIVDACLLSLPFNDFGGSSSSSSTQEKWLVNLFALSSFTSFIYALCCCRLLLLLVVVNVLTKNGIGFHVWLGRMQSSGDNDSTSSLNAAQRCMSIFDHDSCVFRSWCSIQPRRECLWYTKMSPHSTDMRMAYMYLRIPSLEYIRKFSTKAKFIRM